MSDLALNTRTTLRLPLRLLLLLVAALALTAAGAAGWMTRQDDRAPAITAPAVGGGDTLAVIYSGDGGWAAIDKGVTDGFVKAGTPVIGYSSLRYFSTPRTPQAAAADLADSLRRYMAAWGKDRVVLVGYSFGADALPTIIPHLPADLRARVRLVALVGLERQGEMVVHPGSWLNLAGPSAFAVAPTVTALRGAPMVCVYGSREPRSICPLLPSDVIHAVKLRGGHHFDRDYDAITRAILQAMPG